ncbi:hypothetical protein TNCV_5047481 [Trichonephila clavipes]|nr:hypothetical protein TNCV_5047481 [Trichonephila clavipes]
MRFGTIKPLRSSLLALVTSLQFRPRRPLFSSSRSLRGGVNSDIGLSFQLFSAILGISYLFRWHPRHLIFVSNFRRGEIFSLRSSLLFCSDKLIASSARKLFSTILRSRKQVACNLRSGCHGTGRTSSSEF